MLSPGGAWSRGEGASSRGVGVHGPRGGGWGASSGGCMVMGGAWSQGVHGPGASGDPPGWLLLRAVRFLLECILVFSYFLV